jgi:integrase
VIEFKGVEPTVGVNDRRLLLCQGVHPRVVMELLGHSDIAVTMDTYSHVVPELRRQAADQMDAVLAPPDGVATKPS